MFPANLGSRNHFEALFFCNCYGTAIINCSYIHIILGLDFFFKFIYLLRPKSVTMNFFDHQYRSNTYAIVRLVQSIRGRWLQDFCWSAVDHLRDLGAIRSKRCYGASVFWYDMMIWYLFTKNYKVNSLKIKHTLPSS